MSRTDGWRLRVSHETRFDYDAPARASYNELRLTPRTELRQTALETRVVTLPPAPQYSYLDYWGTQRGGLQRRPRPRGADDHGQLARRHAELRASPTTARGRTSPTRRMTMADHLSHHLYTAPGPELSEIAPSLRADRPLETARRIMATTHDVAALRAGVTSVHTSADEAYADGAGVCQDFAHLALALTKSVGLPSRYVSGYFHPDADAAIGEEITGESHAWVEVWTGRWWAYDPTNDCPVGERHVAVGPRARLRRRATGQGHLRRQRREHHAGGGAHGQGALTMADRGLTRRDKVVTAC